MRDDPGQRISRHFVTVGERQVHYRRAGSGPAVILLHGSPQTSEALVPLIETLADRFAVIALDTPWNGYSDPLAEDWPEIADLGSALAGTLDALGIERTGLYGFHTGASIALDFAMRWPDRAAALILDGCALFDAREREDLLENYLPPLEPVWDGSHLAWLWARMMEQQIFFPWYACREAARMDYDVSPPEGLQTTVMEMLIAGDGYRRPYRAAFARNVLEDLPLLKVPTLFTAAAPDPLSAHLDRIGEALPVSGRIERFGREPAPRYARIAAFLGEHPASPSPPAPEAAPCASGAPSSAYVTAQDRQLHLRRVDGKDARPLVLLHDPAGSARLFEPLLKASAGRRPVIAFDLLGHGASDRPGDGNPIARNAAVIGDALDGLGIREADILGLFAGGMIGAQIATSHPGLVARLIQAGAILPLNDGERAEMVNAYAPDLAPRWDGGHLLSAWHFVRLQALFFPWYRRTREAAVSGEPHLDPAMLHRRAVDALRAADAFPALYRAMIMDDLPARLSALSVPWRTAEIPWDAAKPRMAPLTARAQAAAIALPADVGAWGPVLA